MHTEKLNKAISGKLLLRPLEAGMFLLHQGGYSLRTCVITVHVLKVSKSTVDLVNCVARPDK